MLSMLQSQLPAGTSTDTVIKGFEMLLYIARIYSAVITFFENKYFQLFLKCMAIYFVYSWFR